MAAVPASLSFYNADSQSSGLFLNDSGSIAIYTSFGESNSSMTSFSTWSDPYSSSCSEESFTPAATFFGLSNSPAAQEPQLVYPIEEDMLLGGDASEFLQQLHGCNQPVMHPSLVHTLKNLMTPESPDDEYFEENHFSPQHDVKATDSPGRLDGRAVFLALPDSSQMSPSDGSLTSQEVTLAEDSDEGQKHEPPPLNMKRLEKVDDPSDDNIEAAEVSVDLIQNRRPFLCGQAGCNKTFKNPQTMKMHHKTHYTDGSALSKDGVASLPTLIPSLKAGQNKKIPSRCPKCRKTFVGLYELRRHYGRKHSEGEKPFGCRKCEKKFYIEVDVRDHEKLCGEPIECKCGLKFAFKCNLVAHKKAHPVCQNIHNHQRPASNSNNSCNNQSTTSDEDSSHSRGSSGSPPLPRGSIKRHHGQGEESSTSIKNPSSKQMKYNSSDTPPAPNFKGVPEVDSPSLFKAAHYDFAGLQFSTEGSSLWLSNMHYPSVNFANLPLPTPSAMYSSVLGGLEQLGSQIFSSHVPQVHGPCHQGDSKFQSDPSTRLELMDRAPWN